MATTVLFGGQTPIVRVRNWVFRVYSGLRLVRIVRTDAHGRFTGRLPAGRYELGHADTASDRVCIAPTAVRITTRGTTRLPVLITWTPLAAIHAGKFCG